MRIPTNPLKGDSVTHKITEIINFLRYSNLTGVVGGRLVKTPNGSTLFIDAGKGGKTSSSSSCTFGEIYTNNEDPPVTAIRGGLIICGDKNFNVPDQPLTLGTAGTWLVEISLSGVTATTDDDDEIFLPGCTTATGTPDWNNIAYTGTENYTDTDNPTSPTAPTGTIVVGIGTLDIADGVATLAPTGCGTIRVDQCAGLLTHSRG